MFDVKTNTHRAVSAVLVASVASTILASAVGFSATSLGMSSALDYMVDLYVISMLVCVPLCLAKLRRLDDTARLTTLEREVMTAIATCLPRGERDVWDQQVAAISRADRSSDGSNVSFSMRRTGRNPYLPLPVLPRQKTFVIAVVGLTHPELDESIEAKVWCESGRLSFIEFVGNRSMVTAGDALVIVGWKTIVTLDDDFSRATQGR